MTLDEIILGTHLVQPAKGESADSWGRRLLRQGALLGSQWMATQVGPQVVVITSPEPEPQAEWDPPPADAEGARDDEVLPDVDVRTRTDAQSKNMFRLLNARGFDTHSAEGKEKVMNFIHDILGAEPGTITSTTLLNRTEAHTIISRLEDETPIPMDAY